MQTGFDLHDPRSRNKRIELPDRKEITLSEAVTAYVYGKATRFLWHSLNNESATKEQSAKARSLIERLQSAAYAGRIRFRGLKKWRQSRDGHKDIDPLYFSQQRGLGWEADKIWSRAPSRRFPKFEPRPPNFRWIGTTFILTENNLRHCCEKEAFRFSKTPTMPRANKRLSKRACRGDPLRYTSFYQWLEAGSKRGLSTNFD